MKVCRRCGQEKDDREFSKNKNRSDGLSSYCKSCKKLEYESSKDRNLGRKKQYYSENCDKIKSYKKEFYAQNKSEIQAGQKEYREANKEKISVRQKEYRESNKAKVLSRYKRYYYGNRAKRIVAILERKGIVKNRTPAWADLSAIEAIYREAHERGLTVDHYYPLQGKTVSGLHIETNLRIIPQSENDSKCNKHPDDFYGVNGPSPVDSVSVNNARGVG